MYKEKIDSLIRGWKGDLISTLKRWISIDSAAGPSEGEGYPFGKACREMLDMAMADARAMGFNTGVFGGYAGHVLLGEGDQTMGILAHLDIVPAGGGWTHDPFGGEVAGGRLYGRGAIDNKGPAVAALYALRAVREAGVVLKHGVRLILGCAEEIGMDDMRHYAAAVSPPDYGFSPDAGFPLINIEKGGLNLELTYEGNESEARIPVYSMYAGERPNVVPGIARAEVGTSAVTIDELRAALNGLQAEITVSAEEEGRAVIEARGRAAHAAMPASGVNAAGILLTALARVNAGGEGINRVIKALAEKIGMENDGKSLNIAHSEALSGALTCNLGILRCDGRSVRAELDIRYPIGADEEDVRAAVQDTLSGAGIAVTRLQGRPVHHIPKDHRLVRELLSVYSELTGFEAYTIAIGGGTYARMIPNAVAFGCAFPDDADCAHMPDESVDIEKLLLCCRIMAHAIMRLAG